MLAENIYAVILAGGSGTRFWPKSRHKVPKQLCKIGDADHTMIELTLARLDELIPPSRRIIVTHKDQLALTRSIVADSCEHFLAEPMARNTAPALTLAALEIEAMAASVGQSDPIMISLHADALIKDEGAFREALYAMVGIAKKESLTLLGIRPEYPETGYGYIEKGLSIAATAYRVRSFREKPDLRTAQSYLETGHFLWNSGIFAWRVDTILAELDRYFPAATEALRPLLTTSQVHRYCDLPSEVLADSYARIPSMAIDPAVLERSQRVAVWEADIGWKDVGSWDALGSCFDADANGNLLLGDALQFDCQGVTIDTDGPLVACIGLKDTIVVHARGAILVCPQERAQDVKKVVESLKAQGRTDLI